MAHWVEVTFSGTRYKTYSYLCDIKVEKNDKVFVVVGDGVKVVTVHTVHKHTKPPEIASKWIVAKLDDGWVREEEKRVIARNS